MKTFKDLKNRLSEAGGDVGGWGSTNRSAMSDFGAHRMEFEDQVFRVNVFLENYFGRPIIDSVGVFSQLRAKLSIIGLDFEFDPTAVRTEGPFEFPMTRYGGSFGTTPDHDLSKGFYKDDGVPGLSLNLAGEIVKEDTGYVIAAKLVQVPDRTPQEVELNVR